MKQLNSLKFDPTSAIFNNREKINEIVNHINNRQLPHLLINNNLVYARFINPEHLTDNDFYPVNTIEDRGEAWCYVVWCSGMTALLPVKEFEFRAIESMPFNPFNKNSESFPKDERGFIKFSEL